MKYLLLSIYTFFLLTTPVLAQSDFQNCMVLGTYEDCKHLCEPGNIACSFAPAQFFTNPSAVINNLLVNLLLLAGIILFLLVIFAGFQMVTSGGDPAKMEKWRSMLMYGVAGFALVLLAGVIIKLVEVLFGINILNPEAVLNPNP